MKTYASNTKPRYDDGGSEFGDVHRTLPKNIGMFDIDRMKATATIELEITKQNVAFVEYRTKWDSDGNEIEWKALFEVKYRDGPSVQDALRFRKGTASWAQLKHAAALNARYFVVVATEGVQPFTFYEIDRDGAAMNMGVLDYSEHDKAERIREMWEYLGLL